MKKQFTAVVVLVGLLTLVFNCEVKPEKANNSKLVVEKGESGLGQLMLFIQARHTKLAYAIEAENWELADYFAHEMQESFTDINAFHFKHDGIPISKHVTTIGMPAIEALYEQIQKKDKAESDVYFKRLTNACNACHMATEQSMIKIVHPKNGEFTNQDFSVTAGE